MKTTARLCFIVAAALFAAGHLSAQTLKWEYNPSYRVITHNGDGFGGLAVCEEYPGQKARCVWIASNGRPQFTNEFDLISEFNGCAIVRLTTIELAIHFRTRRSESDPIINVLRRFKKTRKGITVTEKILHPNEGMPLAPPQEADRFGFFTTGNFFTDERVQYFSIRRYSN